MAEHTGRGRTRQAKDTGPVKKRKARNVLVTARQTTKGNAAQASDRSELTVKAVMSSLKQQACDLEAQIQEQSVAELAGLTSLDADLKTGAKEDYQDSCKQLEDADKLLDFLEAEWGSDMKDLEAKCISCVAAIRSSTSMLNRVQALQGSFAQQLTQMLAHNKVK